MKIVLASFNQGKIKEFEDVLKSLPVDLVPLSLFIQKEIEETGLSFVENALIKARVASKITKLPAIADDSGLVVPYLNGGPGIYSARYAGKSANAKQNIDKLLSALKSTDQKNRMAFFYCAIVFILDEKDPIPLICEGTWLGLITKREKGKGGFGYDPIFYDPIFKKTAAEFTLRQKNKISHRGKALTLLKKKLPKKINPHHL
jgi:XTP/dITP diphosphohydrolase